MAGGQERVLRRRIRSVQATKKITKAMELIAASQISRAQTASVPTAPTGRGWPASWSRRLAPTGRRRRSCSAPRAGQLGGGPRHRGRPRPLWRVQLLGAACTERLVDQLTRGGATVRLFSVGKKAQGYLRFRGYEVERSFIGFSDRPEFSDARASPPSPPPPFVAGEVDQVLLVSTRYYSAGNQSVATEQLLPLPDPNAGSPRRATSPPNRRSPASRATPNSSPRSSACWASSPREPLSPRSSRRCSRPPRPSTRRSNGPWRPPRRMPTNWCARCLGS